ncbi:unnamed protein product, partial [Gongylonema pulchrum]|uniref:Ovule protein n=1 Tax=Gongylonema pulchrum TaxID=637853 RepID=A0A183D8P5_9BILA
MIFNRDVYSANMLDRNLVKMEVEESMAVPTATKIKDQGYSGMAIKSEDILGIKKESEESCELKVKTEALSDIEEEYPEHLEMKFEIDQ